MTNRFASARTFREGSVGLLILLGLGALGVILLWLNRFTGGASSYKAIIEFANAGGMQKGASVRYRGVKVGSISRVRPGVNAVEVEIQISPPDLIIPSDSVIEANQSGLINESVIDITPNASLSTGAVKSKPLDRNCNKSLIICNGSRLTGQIGISTDALIRQSTELAAQYNNPQVYKNVNKVLENSATAAASVTDLTKDLQRLSRSFQGQLGILSGTAVTIQRATNQLTETGTKTANSFGDTAKQLSLTANEFSLTANEFSLTANQATKLLKNLDNLLTTNRSSLVSTLNNISETSNQLRQTVASLSPAVNRLTQGQILTNLETLSANAAQASANLRDASKTLNDPKNIVLLQQTLDSARVTFENTQKITSDLDELTGDPNFRKNLLQLVNGLSKLVSSTEQIQQDARVAITLDSLKESINQPEVGISPHNLKASVKQSDKQSDVVISTPSPTTPTKKLDLEVKFPSTKTFVNPSDAVISTPIPTASPIKEALSTETPAIPSSQNQLVQQLRDSKK